MDLEDRVALVTGGSGGLGSAIASALSGAGANVAVGCTANADAATKVCLAVEGVGRQAAVVQLDQSDPRSVEAAVEATVRELGRLDVLVNNAVNRPGIPGDSIS